MVGLEGRTLDRYELQQLMGRGGMADVYLAYDPHFDRNVAIKVFKREDEDLLRRFVREAHLMASLSNSHLMPVIDAGNSVLDKTNVYYIVMPLMDGGTLRSLIRRAPLSPTDACRYLRAIAQALDYLHDQGIIHRDIKASNVLLDNEGHCYLSDFGIARTEADSTQMTSTGNVLGTVDYIAPELFETNQRASSKSDLYSLGVLLFEMVTGELPFSAENQIAVVAMHVSKQPPSPRSLIPSLSPAIERVVAKGLEKRPENRFASAGAMADAFCLAASNKPLPAELMGKEPTWEQSTRIVSGTGLQAPAHVQQMGEHVSSHHPITRSVQVTGPTRAYTSGTGYGASGTGYMPSGTGYTPRVPQRPRRQSATQGVIVAVLAVLALVAVLVPAGYILYTNNFANQPGQQSPTAINQATPDLTSTAEVNNSASATAQAQSTVGQQQQEQTATAQAQSTSQAQEQEHATATAQADSNASATAQAQATATAGVIQTATAGQPVYSDPLSDPTNPTTISGQWDQNDQCQFAADGYHVKTSLTDSIKGCRSATQSFSNFTATVDAAILNGGSAGMFFRVSTGGLSQYSGYLFEFNSTGSYKISRSDNFSSSITPLVDWTASDAVQQGVGQQNTLQFTARGGELLFYINGVFLTSVNDTNYANGNIAFLASNGGSDSTEAVYRNLNVYSL